MTWLSLTGLSLDIVGVTLIAWPIVVSTLAAREEGVSRYNGNPWIPVLRRREQLFVLAGAIFLAGGFIFQAAAQVVALHASGELIAGVFASAGIVGVGVVIGRRFAHRNMPKYAMFEDNGDRIKDQRHGSQVATVNDWRNLTNRFHRRGSAPLEVDESREARITQGLWCVPCPQCQNESAGWPDNPQAVCRPCGIIYSAIYPEANDLTTIERLLLRRPQAKRNWRPEDSVKTLRAENRELGLADD